MINNRLDDPRQVATDGTIAAVAALSHLEVSVNDTTTSILLSNLNSCLRSESSWYGRKRQNSCERFGRDGQEQRWLAELGSRWDAETNSFLVSLSLK